MVTCRAPLCSLAPGLPSFPLSHRCEMHAVHSLYGAHMHVCAVLLHDSVRTHCALRDSYRYAPRAPRYLLRGPPCVRKRCTAPDALRLPAGRHARWIQGQGTDTSRDLCVLRIVTFILVAEPVECSAGSPAPHATSTGTSTITTAANPPGCDGRQRLGHRERRPDL